METADETQKRHLESELKQHALEVAYAYPERRDSTTLAFIGAYLLARAAWAISKRCGEPGCECLDGEDSDFRDEAQLILFDALDDIELIETQTEGRA